MSWGGATSWLERPMTSGVAAKSDKRGWCDWDLKRERRGWLRFQRGEEGDARWWKSNNKGVW